MCSSEKAQSNAGTTVAGTLAIYNWNAKQPTRHMQLGINIRGSGTKHTFIGIRMMCEHSVTKLVSYIRLQKLIRYHSPNGNSGIVQPKIFSSNKTSKQMP